MSHAEVLYEGNDMLLEVSGLRNLLTNGYLNTATVAATLKDDAGVDVVGLTWPVALLYVANSDGLYSANLPANLSIVAGDRCTLEVTADAGAGLKAAWTLDCVVRTRRL
jgi:hypothetical protein